MQPLITKPITLPTQQQNSCAFCAGNGFVVVQTKGGQRQVQCTNCSGKSEKLITKSA